jgi:hypothetical protein
MALPDLIRGYEAHKSGKMGEVPAASSGGAGVPGTTEAVEREDILNVAGFSDQVFDVIAEFATGRLASDHWIGVATGI